MVFSGDRCRRPEELAQSEVTVFCCDTTLVGSGGGVRVASGLFNAARGVHDEKTITRTVGVCMAFNRLLSFHVVRSTRPCQYVPACFIGKKEYRNLRDHGHVRSAALLAEARRCYSDHLGVCTRCPLCLG